MLAVLHYASHRRDCLIGIRWSRSHYACTPARPHSSVGESACLVSKRSQVRSRGVGSGSLHFISSHTFISSHDAFEAQLVEQPLGMRQAACSIHAHSALKTRVNALIRHHFFSRNHSLAVQRCASSPTAGGGSLRRSTVQVRILPGAPIPTTPHFIPDPLSLRRPRCKIAPAIREGCPCR